MELCSSTSTLPNFNPSRSLLLLLPITSSSPSITNPFLHFTNKPFNALTLSSSSRQIHLIRPASPLNSTRTAASKTSSPVTETRELEKLPADITVTETPEPNSRLRLSVQVPQAVCEECYQMVVDEFTRQVKVPGFRPGKKLPPNVLVSYFGKERLQNAVVESVLKRTLPHAMSAVTSRALQDSVLIRSKFSDLVEMYSSSNNLTYDITVDVAPEIKWNPENGYKNLKIVVELDNDIDALKASQEELRRRHKSLGILRIVTDRGLQIGDVAVVDISAKTIEQDESNVQNIPSAESKDFNFDTEDGDKVLPGFLDSLIGIRGGETRSFPLVFPESWRQEHLRGVHAEFTVECKELFYRDLPELDDSLADKLLPGCTTLEQVKETLLEKCLEVEKTAKEQATDNAILHQLCKMVEIDIPQSIFEEQGRQLYGSQLLELQTKVKLNEEQLAALSSPKAVSEYLQVQKENITAVLKQNLAVGDIFKRENLEFPTDELVKEVENSIAEFKRHKQEYDEERVKEQVQDILEGAKVLEWLRERAEIQYITN
uniref:peptidylprolyl isomerase n=1 Tax=Pelargonium dichondrifolium TaxID=73194 RepID=A0A0G4AME6_9ROSI|nr:trigger factor type chaperone family protein [Pelargonium dichondrifolium]